MSGSNEKRTKIDRLGSGGAGESPRNNRADLFDRHPVIGTIALLFFFPVLLVLVTLYFFWRWAVEVFWNGKSSDDFLNR
jgi:uncharacterized iron-regulated membrane protein